MEYMQCDVQRIEKILQIHTSTDFQRMCRSAKGQQLQTVQDA